MYLVDEIYADDKHYLYIPAQLVLCLAPKSVWSTGTPRWTFWILYCIVETTLDYSM